MFVILLSMVYHAHKLTGVTLYLSGLLPFFSLNPGTFEFLSTDLVSLVVIPPPYGHDSYRVQTFSGIFCFWIRAQNCHFWESCWFPGKTLRFVSNVSMEKLKWLITFLSALLTCQALVQFSDVETASAARNALDSRSIPRYTQIFCMPSTHVFSP